MMSRSSRICMIDGCNRKNKAYGLCEKHASRLKRNGSVYLNRIEWGTGGVSKLGYVQIRLDGIQQFEHVRVAEKALGKSLPKGAVVHHIDGNPSNNSPHNLVICPNIAYHNLIHKRQRAFEDCGNSEWLKCPYCRKYDDSLNMSVGTSYSRHKECYNAYMRLYNKNKSG